MNGDVEDHLRALGRRNGQERRDHRVVRIGSRVLVHDLRGAGLAGDPKAGNSGQHGRAPGLGRALHHGKHRAGDRGSHDPAHRFGRKVLDGGAVGGDHAPHDPRPHHHSVVGDGAGGAHDLDRRHRHFLTHRDGRLGAQRPPLDVVEDAGGLTGEGKVDRGAESECAERGMEAPVVDPVGGVAGTRVARIPDDVRGSDRAVYLQVRDPDGAAARGVACVVAAAIEGIGRSHRSALQQGRDGEHLEHGAGLVGDRDGTVDAGLRRARVDRVRVVARRCRIGQQLPGLRHHDQDRHRRGSVLGARANGDLLHRVLHVHVDGEHDLVAPHQLCSGLDDGRREHVIEGVLDPVKSDVVDTHEAEYMAGEFLLGVGAPELGLQRYAAQLAGLQMRAQLRRLGRRDLALEIREVGPAPEPLFQPRPVEVQHFAQRGRGRRGVGHVRGPDRNRVETRCDRQQPPVAVQYGPAFDVGDLHRGARVRQRLDDHQPDEPSRDRHGKNAQAHDYRPHAVAFARFQHRCRAGPRKM